MSRNRKKKPSKPYRGYCTFPLVGADTYREFQETAEMFGDFADPVKRKRIFDKPRKYRFEIWLKLHGKPEYEIREARITSEGVTRENLSRIVVIPFVWPFGCLSFGRFLFCMACLPSGSRPAC